MVTIASINLVRNLLLLSISLLLGASFVFHDVSDAYTVILNRRYDIVAFSASILLSSLVVDIIGVRLGDVRLGGFIKLILSLVIASNAAFLAYWQGGLFDRQEAIVLQVLCVYGLSSAAWLLLADNWKSIPGMVKRVVVVGNGEMAEEMKGLVKQASGRYELREFIECLPGQFGESGYDMCSTRSILEKAKQAKAHKVVVSLSERRGAFPLQDVLSCKLSGMQILDAPGFYEEVNRKLMLENITPSWFIFAGGFKITGVRRFVKRFIDIVLSFIGILMVLPLFPLVAFAIKLDSPGPIFFKQIRVGMSDKDFMIYKFRTMRADAEKFTGAVWANKNDNRITKLGNFLRKSRIDELPQLFNVLIGNMSLVGPRPERPEFVRDLKKVIPYYSERHFVKPGITGWAQVRYPYGASVDDAIEKLRYDLYYIKNYTLLFDFRIMIDTVSVMAKKMGR